MAPEQKAAFLRSSSPRRVCITRGTMRRDGADVVLLDGVPVGRLLVARWRGRDPVVDISILPEFRGAGAGGALLRELADEADGRRKRLSIHVEHENPRGRSTSGSASGRPASTGVYLRMEPRSRVRSGEDRLRKCTPVASRAHRDDEDVERAVRVVLTAGRCAAAARARPVRGRRLNGVPVWSGAATGASDASARASISSSSSRPACSS